MTAAKPDAGWTAAQRRSEWSPSPSRTVAQPPSRFSSERLARLIRFWPVEQAVRFTVSTPDTDRHSAVAAVGLDLLDARLRQVVFVDTPDLTLTRQGIALWVRRTQRRPASAGITFRPWDRGLLITPGQCFANVAKDLRGFDVEIDAVPGGYACATTRKTTLDDIDVKGALAGRRPVGQLFTRDQRTLLKRLTSDEFRFDDLLILGPIDVFRIRFAPAGFDRSGIAELWNYPEGSRILKLTMRCTLAAVFDIAAATRVLLDTHGIGGLAEPHRSTATALERFARALREPV